MTVTANTNPAPGAVALPSTNTKQETEEDEPIKCKYMRAAHGYLRWVGETSLVLIHALLCSNTTFHGISWVLTDVSRAAKVTRPPNLSFCQPEFIY